MTAQTLKGAVTAVASVVASVSGIDSSPSLFRFNINDRIFALNYPLSGVCEISETGTKQWLALIVSDLLTPQIDIVNEDIGYMLDIAEAATTAMISEASSAGTGTMFDGAIDTYANCRFEFIPNYIYNNILYTCYRIMLEDVKLKLDL